MSVNILIAGNGLDLHHGYNTGYVDFLQYAKKEGWHKNNGFLNFFISELEARDREQKWIDCEEEIREAIECFNHILKHRGDTSVYKNRTKAVADCFRLLYGQQEGSVYFSHLDDKNGRYWKESFINALKEDLDTCIQGLKEYLLIETEEPKGTKAELLDEKIDCLVSFNYTKTHMLYGKKESTSFWIHGSLEKNNMVFGTEDDDNNMDFVFFKKYFQRIQKNTDLFYTEGIDPSKGIHNHFYGCSFGYNDADILKEIMRYPYLMENPATDKIINYIYCNGQSDYECKVVNLIRILGKEAVIKWHKNRILQFKNITKENRDFSELDM